MKNYVSAYFEDILSKCPEYKIPPDFIECLQNLNLRLSSHWWCFSSDIIQRCHVIENHLKDLNTYSRDDLFVKCEYDFIRTQLSDLPHNACLYLLLRSIERRKHLGEIFNSGFFSGYSHNLCDDYDLYKTFTVHTTNSIHSYQLICKTKEFYIECRFKDVNFGEPSRYFDCSFILLRFHWYRPVVCIYCEQLIIYSEFCSEIDDQFCYSICNVCSSDLRYPRYKNTIVDRDDRFCNNLNLKIKLKSFKDILRCTIQLHNFVETLTHVKTICRQRRSNDRNFRITQLHSSEESTDDIVRKFCKKHDIRKETVVGKYYEPHSLTDICTNLLRNILCQDAILYEYAGPFRLKHLFKIFLVPFLYINRGRGTDEYWENIQYSLKTPASSEQSSSYEKPTPTLNPNYDCSWKVVERFRKKLLQTECKQE